MQEPRAPGPLLCAARRIAVLAFEHRTCALELSTKLGNFPPNFPLQAGPGSIVELGSDLKGTLAIALP